MGNITFITGGVRSGKSSYAVEIAKKYEKRFFIATAEAFDENMKKRIENHKKERGSMFETIEESVYLSRAINRIGSANVCVIDCITVWINNLIYYDKQDEIGSFLESLTKCSFDVVIVSNEVGLGVMPDNELSMRYIDLLGDVNKKIAKIADYVFFMVSGLALKLKGG